MGSKLRKVQLMLQFFTVSCCLCIVLKSKQFHSKLEMHNFSRNYQVICSSAKEHVHVVLE